MLDSHLTDALKHLAPAVAELVQEIAGAVFEKLYKLVSVHSKEFEIEKVPGIKTS
jgi:hypothetical protein